MVDRDRCKGTAKETFGKVEATIGDALGDKETQASGRTRQATGAAQDVYGQAKDTLGETFGDASQSAEKALHSLKQEVEARPLIALLIAALVGFVIAQLTTN